MPTPTQIRNRVNTILTPFWQDVKTRQAAYLVTHGAYWQGRRTHTLELEYTGATDAERTGNNLDSVAGSVVGSWKQFKPSIDGQSLPARFRMDVYVDGQAGNAIRKAYMTQYRIDNPTWDPDVLPRETIITDAGLDTAGHGFTLTARFKYNGRVFERKGSVGPQDRAYDWIEIIE